jgi:hypothetical protein
MNAESVAVWIAARNGGQLRPDGNGGFLVCCPAHDDDRPSLHISKGDDGHVLVYCHGGCETSEVLAAVGLQLRDLFAKRRDAGGDPPERVEYPYGDADGDVRFVIVRTGHGKRKKFSCYHVDEHGERRRGIRGLKRLLYRLPEVLAAAELGESIYLCEGEKDADAMAGAYGVCATTNPHGGTAWANDCDHYGYDACLKGAKVVVVEDADTAGRLRTGQIFASLRGIAASLRVVRAARGKDAYDHVAAGLELHDFVAVIGEAAPVDDGSFAAIPTGLFEAAQALNLSHLDFRVLIEIARHSVHREAKCARWQVISCPSSWLAKCCGNASPPQVRASTGRLCRAGILRDERSADERGGPARFSVNPEFASWRPLRREPARSRQHVGLSPARTTPVSCEDANTREELGVREEGKVTVA